MFVESVRDRADSPVYGVTITSGKRGRKVDELNYNCSKQYLMSILRQALNNGWLNIRCEGPTDLKAEMMAFVTKSNGKLEAAGNGKDDMVLSVALSLLSYVT